MAYYQVSSWCESEENAGDGAEGDGEEYSIPNSRRWAYRLDSPPSSFSVLVSIKMLMSSR